MNLMDGLRRPWTTGRIRLATANAQAGQSLPGAEQICMLQLAFTWSSDWLSLLRARGTRLGKDSALISDMEGSAMT